MQLAGIRHVPDTSNYHGVAVSPHGDLCSGCYGDHDNQLLGNSFCFIKLSYRLQDWALSQECQLETFWFNFVLSWWLCVDSVCHCQIYYGMGRHASPVSALPSGGRYSWSSNEAWTSFV